MRSKRNLSCESLESRKLLAADMVLPTGIVGDGVPSMVHIAPPVQSVVADLVNQWDVSTFPMVNERPDFTIEQDGRLLVVDQSVGVHTPNTLWVFERDADGARGQGRSVSVDFAVEQLVVYKHYAILVNSSGLQKIDTAEGYYSLEPESRIAVVDLTKDTLSAQVETLPGAVRDVYPLGERLAVSLFLSLDAADVTVMPQMRQQVIQLYTVNDQGLELQSSNAISGRTVLHQSGSVFTISDSLVPPQLILDTLENHDVLSPHGAVALSLLAPGIGADGELTMPVISDLTLAGNQSILNQYRIGDNGLVMVSETPLGAGWVQMAASAGQDTAVLVRSDYHAQTGVVSEVDILDLSTDVATIFQTITLESTAAVPVGIDDGLLVMHDVATPEILLLIDTNTDIDVAPANRVSQVTLSDTTIRVTDFVRMGADRLLVSAQRFVAPLDIDPVTGDEHATRDERGTRVDPATRHERETRDGRPRKRALADRLPSSVGGITPERVQQLMLPHLNQVETVLMTISLSDLSIQSTTVVGDGMFMLDSPTIYQISSGDQRLAVRTGVVSDDGHLSPGLVVGHLNDVGGFVTDGQLDGLRMDDEIDVNAERLLVHNRRSISEYLWDNLDEAHWSAALKATTDVPVRAVDDFFHLDTLDENGQILDVLANDRLGVQNGESKAHIAELIGAPEGASLIEGTKVFLPADAFAETNSVSFQYVLTNGASRSVAKVHVNIDSVSEQRIKELVDKMTRTAAHDFQVPWETVDVTSVDILTQKILWENDLTNLEILKPSVVVLLKIGDQSAIYSAEIESGNVIRVYPEVIDPDVDQPQARLEVRAVDDQGHPLEQVQVGDSFWLELRAADLRKFGAGVYAAFMDLELPDGIISLTGEVVAGEGFSVVNGGSVSDNSVDELGALRELVDAPGTAIDQVVLRIAATAKVAGNIELTPTPADSLGTDLLVYGSDEPVSVERITYATTELQVVDPIETTMLADVDGDGEIKPIDALQVINMVTTFGSGTFEELNHRVERAYEAGVGHIQADQAGSRAQWIRRHDTNGDQVITPLDALIVINYLSAQRLGGLVAQGESQSDRDDEDETTVQDSIPGLF